MPKLLIVTGPQGSGNHAWAKIFSKHKSVFGWDMKQYWEGHHREPFSKYWHCPELLDEFRWDFDYYVTSISCPYYRDKMPHVPKYKKFIQHLPKDVEIVSAIIGRDKTILDYQQQRVRGKNTTDISQFLDLPNKHFISTELLHLYKLDYIRYVSSILNFPISDDVMEHIQDPNVKYVRRVPPQSLDYEVSKACSES